MPASRVSSSSTLVDVASKASGASSKMPASLIPGSSTMSVDVVSRAWWSEWDPGNRWGTRNKYKLAARPQEGYCFPEYLGHDADYGPYRLGAVFSNPDNLDTILFVPKAMPEGCHVSVSGPDVLSESDEKFPPPPSPGPVATREFRFQRLENRLVSLTPGDLKRIAEHPPVKKILDRLLGSRSVYVITGLKIVDGLEVLDGEFYRKFEGRVIFSYQMHKVHGTFKLRKVIVEKP